MAARSAPSVSPPPPPSPAPPASASGSAGPFDLDSPAGLRQAVAARARRDDEGDELILFTSNAAGLPAAFNLALQLRRLRISHDLILADAPETCARAGSMQTLLSAPLGCGSLPKRGSTHTGRALRSHFAHALSSHSAHAPALRCGSSRGLEGFVARYGRQAQARSGDEGR